MRPPSKDPHTHLLLGHLEHEAGKLERHSGWGWCG